jgi:hypothetical protein
MEGSIAAATFTADGVGYIREDPESDDENWPHVVDNAVAARFARNPTTAAPFVSRHDCPVLCVGGSLRRRCLRRSR